jgi:integrase
MTVSNLYLFKRPNGFWYVLYTADGRKKWKSTKCRERSDALRKLTEFKELIKSKPVTNQLSSFTDDFLSYASATYAKASVDIFKVGLRNLQAISGDCKLTSITSRHVDQYKAERLRAVSPTSVNVELRALRAILNIALRWNLLETNPFSKMKCIKIPETTPIFFSKDDFQRFMDAVGDHWMKDSFLFAVMTGMRRGEVLNLKWSDVKLEEKIAHIQSSPTYRVKAGKSRTIPLGDIVLNLLERRAKTSKSEFVFDYDGKMIKGDHIARQFKKFVLKAGLNKKLHFHSLRHTFATWLVQGRVSIYEIQKLLGHSDISMTQIYSHLVSSELHDAVNRISVRVD